MFGLFPSKLFSEAQNQVDANFSAATRPGASLPTVYKAARPIIVFASTFTIIPQDWRQVLQAFIFSLDNLLLKALEPPADTPAHG